MNCSLVYSFNVRRWNLLTNAAGSLEMSLHVEPEFLEVIIDRQKAAHILSELAKSVKNEAHILLPNDKAMIRIQRLGILDSLVEG